jgi:sialate O-acetylesterase
VKRSHLSRTCFRHFGITGAFCLVGFSLNCLADPWLPNLFSDHMVLEQARPIHIWGKADAREKLSVGLATESTNVVADEHGRWSVDLPPLPAGGPFTLSIRGKKEIVIRDVMIGEVWVASGQSNMTFPLDGSENGPAEVAKADYPQIRLFNVPKKIALSPQENTLAAHWQICTPETAKDFSAVGYFFAREIHRKLNVPVGVMESAWPGTTIQEWIAPEVLRGDPELKSAMDEWDHATTAEKSFAETPLPYQLEFDNFELLHAPPDSSSTELANFDDGTTHLATGGSFRYSWGDAPGTTVELSSPGRGASRYCLRVAGRLDGTQDSILTARYKPDGSAVDLSGYAGIRFWVRGNGSFRFRSLQPTITDYDDYATPLLKASPEWQPFTIWFHNLRQDGWGVVQDFAQNALTGFSLECLTALEYPPMPVSALYEGMITPFLPYGFRGVLWYQGESNALNAHQYSKLLPALIRNWRDASNQKDLEFLIVQLPNHGALPEEPVESAWAELREAQLMTIKDVPHTGLAVTIDVGDPKDLHPHRKLEVGHRLALWALGDVYQQTIEYSGPLFESMTIQGAEARLHFTHVGAGLDSRGDRRLQGFAIAGADRKFHWADARIEGTDVIVSSHDVPNPVAVRYAWGDSPRCNLFNADGLPASPFRTDDWPGITGN